MQNSLVIMTGLDKNKPPMFKNNCGRTLSNHAIMFIMRGHGRFEDETTKKTEVKAGTVFFLYPGKWHNFDPDPGTTWTEYWTLFDGAKAEALFGNIIPSGCPLFFHGLSSPLKESYESLHAEQTQKSPFRRERELYWLHHILMLVFMKTRGGVPPLGSELIISAKTAASRAVHKNIPFDFKSFAEDAGVGYEKFRKDFAKETGFSPANYLTSYKITRAMEMLAAPSLTVKEVSAALGFQDPYYFSRLFKRKEGVSPENFRKKLFSMKK